MAGLSDPKPVKSEKQDNMPDFQPIEKTTIPGEIVDQVLSMILTRKLKAGDRLPSERQLCESLNVGRSSVREALKALEALGIIRRDMRGTTICSPDENSYPGLSLTAGGAPLEQLFETAGIVGIEAAGLAAERASRQDMDKMAKIMRKTEDTQEAVVIHLSFHRALVNATRNPVLSQVYNMLVALITRSPQLSLPSEEMEEGESKAFIANLFDGHRKILRAIESHNSEAARECMKDHYEDMENVALRDMNVQEDKVGGKTENLV